MTQQQHRDWRKVRCSPTNLQYTQTVPTALTLTWQDGSPDESGFAVERSVDNGATWTTIIAVSANITTFVDSPLQCSEIHLYRIRAFRSGDGAYSDYSNVITVWTPPCSPTAAQARNLAANAIELTWQDNSDDESEFQIERRPGNSSTWSQIDTVLANIHSYTDDQVECSTPYSYRVRAYRAHDQRYSDYSKVATGSTRSCTPTNLQADLASSDSVTLTWQDASPDETEFKVERSMDEGATWAVVGAAPANSTTHTDVGLSCSTSYFYRVHAFRSGDGAYSDYSNVASVHTPPCAPTNARASNQISGTVELAWQDNSSDESEFQIERRPDGITQWAALAVAAANAHHYVDGAAQCSSQYFYRVRSYRASDGQPSATYSNEAGVHTVPCEPTEITATAISPSKISLAWTDNANDETGFFVESSQDGVTGWLESNLLGADSTEYVATGLSCRDYLLLPCARPPQHG